MSRRAFRLFESILIDRDGAGGVNDECLNTAALKGVVVNDTGTDYLHEPDRSRQHHRRGNGSRWCVRAAVEGRHRATPAAPTNCVHRAHPRLRRPAVCARGLQLGICRTIAQPTPARPAKPRNLPATRRRFELAATAGWFQAAHRHVRGRHQHAPGHAARPCKPPRSSRPTAAATTSLTTRICRPRRLCRRNGAKVANTLTNILAHPGRQQMATASRRRDHRQRRQGVRRGPASFGSGGNGLRRRRGHVATSGRSTRMPITAGDRLVKMGLLAFACVEAAGV